MLDYALDVSVDRVLHLGHLLGKLELVIVKQRGVRYDDDGDANSDGIEDRASTCKKVLSAKSSHCHGGTYRHGR